MTKPTGRPRGRRKGSKKQIDGDTELLAIGLAVYLKSQPQFESVDTFVIAAQCFTQGVRTLRVADGRFIGLEYRQTGEFTTQIRSKARTYRSKWERLSGKVGKANGAIKVDQEAVARIISASLVWDAFFSSDRLAGADADFINLFVAHTFKDWKVGNAMADRLQELREAVPSAKTDLFFKRLPKRA